MRAFEATKEAWASRYWRRGCESDNHSSCEDMTSSASNYMSSHRKFENASPGTSPVSLHGATATDVGEVAFISATKVTDAE
jgi:hypothetical protein